MKLFAICTILLTVGLGLTTLVVLPTHATPASAPMTTFTVNSTLDAVDASPGDGICATSGGICTLRAAVQEANALAGLDTITLPSGTYQLTIVGTGEDQSATGDLDITDDLVINGAISNTTIVDGNALDHVFHISNSNAVTLTEITIQNGNAPFINGFFDGGGGIRALVPRLAVISCTITNNNSIDRVGGIFSISSSVEIIGSQISQNTSQGGGGGFSSASGDPEIIISNTQIISNTTNGYGGGIAGNNFILQDTTLSGNSGNHGGAAYIGGFLSNNNSDIQNSQFFNNRANDGGGALYYSSDGTELTIANSTFTGNEVESTATSSGGAILISGYSLAISITNSHFMHNDSRVYAGGAIHNFADNSSFTVANTTFISNTANTIGGAFSSGGDNVVSMISDSTFTNNSSSFSGGAIHIQALTNTVTIADSYFSQNLASYYGGAIRLYGAGPTFEKIGVTAHIADSTLEGNIATLGGGALASGVGTFTAITNTAFVYNMSDGNGGAFHISSDGTMGGAYGHIANSTFSHNQTAQSGGAIYGYNSSTNLSFRNTTIAYNVADSDSDGVGSGGGVTLDNMPQFTFGNSLIANNIDNGNEAPGVRGSFVDGN